MSLTFLGWLFIALAIPILLHFLMGTRGLRKDQHDVENVKASLEHIALRLKNGEITEAEADAARLALLSRLPSSRWGFSKSIPGQPQMLFAAGAVFLLVSGVGAAVSHYGGASETAGAAETIAFSEPDGETLSHLTDYARAIGSGQPASMAAPAEALPDVNAMIERLAARLETTPQDLEGWRMLGWSYFHTERYGQAAEAFGRALALDPSSAELKLSYEEAKAKDAAGGNLETTASLQSGRIDGSASGGQAAAPAAVPGGARDAAIRSMVDGLALRLEDSPRDVDGWINLMRSRIVLGEGEKAATAFRKAREVFADDPAAAGKITAAASAFGLEAE